MAASAFLRYTGTSLHNCQLDYYIHLTWNNALIDESPYMVIRDKRAANQHKRLQEHNEGLNTFTRGRGPWKLIFVQSFETRQEALNCEKKLKRCNKDYLNWLIQQPVNILDR